MESPNIAVRQHMMRCMLTANLAVDMRFVNGTQECQPISASVCDGLALSKTNDGGCAYPILRAGSSGGRLGT